MSAVDALNSKSAGPPPRLADGDPLKGDDHADPCERRARDLLRLLRVPPRLDEAASARLADRLARASVAARPRWALAVPALVAAALIAVIVRPHQPAFHARGTAAPPSGPPAEGLEIFRLGGGKPEPLGAVLHRTDELAFAYRNQNPGRHLLVFGRDEHGHVYWYHPAWTDAADDPAAVPLSAAPGLHELPAAIAHSLDGHHLRLCWLFADQALRAREVEAALVTGGLAPNCRSLEVTP